MTDGMGPLDLSGANTAGFEAVDAGRYNAAVADLTWDSVKNTSGTGKMPAGTPLLKVRFKLLSDLHGDESAVEGKSVFASYVVPPKDYDVKKAAIMQGMIVNLFVALGDDEADVKSKKFQPELADYIGRECVVTVSKEPKKDQTGNIIEGEYNNPVKGVKPAGSVNAPSGLL